MATPALAVKNLHSNANNERRLHSDVVTAGTRPRRRMFRPDQSQETNRMTDSDRLVASLYAASNHSLEEFLERYQQCLDALQASQSGGAAEAETTAQLGDALGGPA
jgi:hypothetical protein